MTTEHKRKSLIVSGGTRGLGLAIVAHCLERRCAVATFAKRETKEIGALRQQYPSQLYFELLDAREAEGIGRFIDRVEEKLGPIYGLVNNAAVGQDNLLSHMSPAAVDCILAVNLKAPILLTRIVVRKMLLNSDGGRIVNITSICGARGYAGLTVYSATKGGMDAFTRSLARELGSRGILVNAIAPGFFASAMSSALVASELETIRRRTPTERLCTEQDILPILDVLLFASIGLTGQTICVDGGSSA